MDILRGVLISKSSMHVLHTAIIIIFENCLLNLLCVFGKFCQYVILYQDQVTKKSHVHRQRHGTTWSLFPSSLLFLLVYIDCGHMQRGHNQQSEEFVWKGVIFTSTLLKIPRFITIFVVGIRTSHFDDERGFISLSLFIFSTTHSPLQLSCLLFLQMKILLLSLSLSLSLKK